MIEKNYLHFSSEDFASDPYFQKWVLENDHMTNLFWEKWLADNPQKKKEVEFGKILIGQFNFKQYEASSKDFDEVWKNIKETHMGEVSHTWFFRKKWFVLAAACITALIVSTIFFIDDDVKTSTNDNQVASPLIINNSIKAGTDKAILTLANGATVPLVKGKKYTTQNANSDGEEIVYDGQSFDKEIAYNYLTTPRGGQFSVKLADGSQVWLNSESRLKYPIAFLEGETRHVELVYGEAYFDISPSSEHKGAKFKVTNQDQEVMVLGTEFNIKAYKDESVLYTTLVEGKVAISVLNKNEILAPNQQFRLNTEDHTSTVYKVDVYREISWKNGVFSFKRMPLKNIVKVLSRWYEIDVKFENKALENITFSGTLKKKLGIDEILETICNVNNIQYEIRDKTVVLK